MKRSTKTPRARATKRPTVEPVPPAVDDAILSMLARRVRVLTSAQIARTWWPSGTAAAKQCRSHLLKLARNGDIEIFKMMAHPEIELAEPLAVWQVGLALPDMGSVSHRAKRRWPLASVQTEMVAVTEQGSARFATSAPRRPRISEATHDLHLTAAYLLMARTLPTRAMSWRCEADVAAWLVKHRPPGLRNQKLPDAMVRDGRSSTAIEFVGDYPPAKLRAFHDFCREQGWGYELW